jgi:hypothetical protein
MAHVLTAYLGAMDHPKAVGDRCVLAAMLALQEAGFRTSIPLGENARYDLVIDDGTTLSRVQCKKRSAAKRGHSLRHLQLLRASSPRERRTA